MKNRTVGASKMEVSPISLGCMRIGTDKKKAATIIESAIDYGITLFDTADVYDRGENEVIVGHVLKSYRSNNQIRIATKGGNVLLPNETKRFDWNATPAYLREAITASLKRLQTDVIDFYELHGGMHTDDLDAVIETFEQFKKEGLIRAYGLSSIRPNVFRPFLSHKGADVLMTPYHFLDRRIEEWQHLLSETNTSLFVRGALGKGLFSSAPRLSAQAIETLAFGYTASEARATYEQLCAQITP
ncbi:MAG: aldo/keto reductase, partial [Bacilli bacterium]